MKDTKENPSRRRVEERKSDQNIRTNHKATIPYCSEGNQQSERTGTERKGSIGEEQEHRIQNFFYTGETNDKMRFDRTWAPFQVNGAFAFHIALILTKNTPDSS